MFQPPHDYLRREMEAIAPLLQQERKPELWKAVPSCWFDYQAIYDEAVATAPPGSTLIEIGSFWGQSVIYLAEAAQIADKQLKVYCVDPFGMRPWNNKPLFDRSQYGAHVEPRVHGEHHDSQFETFAYFLEQTRLSPDPLRVMRMESLEAACMFDNLNNMHVHFVFLDGDHEYDYVLKELNAWTPLLMEGGIIAGHDYTEEFDGVRRATREYFGSLNDVHDQYELSVECGRSWIVRPCA